MTATQPGAAGYFWQGDTVRLRPILPGDWAVVYEQEQDSEAVRALEATVRLPAAPEQLQETLRQLSECFLRPNENDNLTFAVETPDGKMAGTANLYDRDPHNGTFSIAARIYAPYQGRGYATDALRVVLRYAFHELRYQKANSATLEGNTASMHLHEALGFRLEGRRRRSVYTGGAFYDEILYGMTREEFDEAESRRRAAPKQS